MMKMAEIVSALLRKGEAALRSTPLASDGTVMDSGAAHLIRKAAVIPGRNSGGEAILLVVADSSKTMPDHFQGETRKLPGGFLALWGTQNHANAQALCRHFPWCTPLPPPEKGILLQADSLENSRALFTAALKHDFFPVASGWDEAVFTAFSLDFRKPFGAKTEMELLQGEELPQEASRPEKSGETILGEYSGKNFVLKGSLSLSFSAGMAETSFRRWKKTLASAKGGPATTFAPVAKEGVLSCQEHLFLVRELRKRNVEFSGFSPCFSRDQKTFFRDLPLHAAIAGSYGGCRLHLPELFWQSPLEAHRFLPDGFAAPWNPALCPDLDRFFSNR